MPTVADGVEKIQGQLVSANYFSELGVPATIGRTFLPEEDRAPGANPVMVISHSYWERRFHSDPAIVGRIVNLNGAALTIVGVAAQEFTGTDVIPRIPDFWAPVTMQQQIAPGRDLLGDPSVMQLQILARLKPGKSRSRAEAETAVLIRQFADTYKVVDRTTTVTLQRTAMFGNTEDPRFQASAVVMMLIVGMVLLVGCVNIANMLLARGGARQKEISVRLALGASRGRVIRQLLIENFLLAMLGGIGGLLLSVGTARLLWIALGAIRATVHPRCRSRDRPEPGLARGGLRDAAGADRGTALRPLSRAPVRRPDLTASLKEEGGFGAQWSRSRLRGLLVGMQVTVSMFLLITAGLLMRGLNPRRLPILDMRRRASICSRPTSAIRQRRRP